MRPHLSAATRSIAVAAFVSYSGFAGALSDLLIKVDCAGGDRIERALSRVNVLDRRMVIVVSGTCTENVVIERDDVVLRAGSSGGGVSAADDSRASPP